MNKLMRSLSLFVGLCFMTTTAYAQSTYQHKPEEYHGIWQMCLTPKDASSPEDMIDRAKPFIIYKFIYKDGTFMNIFMERLSQMNIVIKGTYTLDAEGNICEEQIAFHMNTPSLVGSTSKIRTIMLDNKHFILKYTLPNGIENSELWRRVPEKTVEERKRQAI